VGANNEGGIAKQRKAHFRNTPLGFQRDQAARFGVCAIAGNERSPSAKAAFFILASRSAHMVK
jgi:hypothetical protein